MDDSVIKNFLLPQQQHQQQFHQNNNPLLATPSSENPIVAPTTSNPSTLFPHPLPPSSTAKLSNKFAAFNALLTPSVKDEEKFSLFFAQQQSPTSTNHPQSRHQQQKQQQSSLISNHLLELQKEIKEEEEEIFADINSLINRGSQHLYFSNLVDDIQAQSLVDNHVDDNHDCNQNNHHQHSGPSHVNIASKLTNIEHKNIDLPLSAQDIPGCHQFNQHKINDAVSNYAPVSVNRNDNQSDDNNRFCNIIGTRHNKIDTKTINNSQSTTAQEQYHKYTTIFNCKQFHSNPINNSNINHNNNITTNNNNSLRNYLSQRHSDDDQDDNDDDYEDDIIFKANIISEKDNYQRNLANDPSVNLKQNPLPVVSSSLPQTRHLLNPKYADWDDEKIISSTTDDLTITPSNKIEPAQVVKSQISNSSLNKSVELMRNSLLLGHDEDDEDDDEDIKYLRQSQPKQQISSNNNSIVQDDEEHQNYIDEHGFASCSQVDQQDYQKLQAVIQQVTSNLPKPCVFFLEGNCRRTDCKYSHDLSNITCKYWIEGFCFKGDLCPFLHSYTPQDPALLDEDAIDSLSKKKFYPTFVIESEADFPSLPLDAPPTALNDSSKSSNDTDTITTTIKNQILNSNPAVVFKTIKKKRKRG